MTRKKQRGGKKGVRYQRGSRQWLYVAVPILAAVLIGVGGGWFLARQRGTGSTRPEVQLASVSQLPEQVRRAPPMVQEAYRFAIANPEVLSRLPCYCGCGNIGHKSNLDCFIREFKPDGTIVFDDHAFN